MAGTRPYARGALYGVSGSSALAQPRRPDDDRQGAPAYDAPLPLKRPPPLRTPGLARGQPQARNPSQTQAQALAHARPPARRRARQGVRALWMMVSLGAVLTMLCAVSISKQASCSALQKQMTAIQQEIKRTQEANQLLEMQLASATDGELIRNYAVNTLGMARIKPEDIRTVRMPDTRPNGEPERADVQEITIQRGGFWSTLADLLRLIRI